MSWIALRICASEKGIGSILGCWGVEPGMARNQRAVNAENDAPSRCPASRNHVGPHSASRPASVGVPVRLIKRLTLVWATRASALARLAPCPARYFVPDFLCVWMLTRNPLNLVASSQTTVSQGHVAP